MKMGLGSLCPGVFNEPLGVDWKLLAGTGPRWKVVEKDQFVCIWLRSICLKTKKPGIC